MKHIMLTFYKWRLLQAVNQAGHVSGTEAIIDVHDRYVAGATIEHAEQRRQTVKASAIADAGRNRDDRAGDEAADDAG
jgi:hypothetical protein